MINEPVNIGDKVVPVAGVFMPYWSPGAIIVEVGTPMAYKNDPTKIPGGDWVIISTDSGWLPRNKFKKA